MAVWYLVAGCVFAVIAEGCIIARQTQRIKRADHRVKVARGREDVLRGQLRDSAITHAHELSELSAKYHAKIAEVKEAAEEKVAAAQSVTQSFANQLVTLANKPPVIVREDISAVGEALAKILSPSQPMTTTNPNDETRATNMDALGLTNNGDVKPQQWFPDVEFDEYMEDVTRWPTTGGWVTGTPTTPSPDTTPVHRITPNGTVTREDGQPMFQPGTGAPPPVGGVE